MEENNGTALSNIVTINGQEYDATEAHSLIEKGRMTSEYEQKWNTSLDKVWPEYGKSRETIKSLESQLTDSQKQLQEFQVKKDAGTETPADVQQAKEAARKLGIILKDDLEQTGYIKKDELPKYFQQFQQEQEAVKAVLNEAEKLEKEIDGTDGRPKFNKKVVLAYANSYGKTDLKEAYEEMHEDSLKAWKDNQISMQKKPSLKTLRANGGSKEPGEVTVNDDNVNDLLKEALYSR